VIGFIFWSCSGLQSSKAKMVWDRFQLVIPVVGSIRLRLGIARLARMLSLLLQSGVQLVEGMAILQGALDNKVLGELLHEAELEVRKGGSLARCFGQQAQWPALVKQMVMIGEEAGNLDEMLAHLAHFYEQETRLELKNLMALLGPVLILILTGVVFLIIVAILIPIINVPLLD
jgi:type IV pilus assembly protein PilC